MDAITERVTLPEPDIQEMSELLLRFLRGVNAHAFDAFGDKVRFGPFFGMQIPRFNPFWDDGNAGAKLFGSYEMELHPFIEFAMFRRPKVIVNVGCAEGYYAIGLKRMREEAKVFAMDLSEGSLSLCNEYAKRNGVEITTKFGATDFIDLDVEAHGHRFYFMDVEGAEIELVNAGFFKNFDLIVECHDFLAAGASSIIADRLWPTHRVELVRSKLMNMLEFDVVRMHPNLKTILAVLEKRPTPTTWLACWANEKGV